MKRLIHFSVSFVLICASLLFFASCEKLDTGKIEIVGSWRYNSSSGVNVTTTVTSDASGKIVNNKIFTSGTLQLKLYWTETKYESGSILGYVMADYILGTLDGGDSFVNVSFTSTKGYPPHGSYYVTLVLLEYQNDGYYIIDHLNFDNMITVSSTNSPANEVTKETSTPLYY